MSNCCETHDNNTDKTRVDHNKEIASTKASYDEHDMMHGGQNMAKDFLKRFWIVTGLLVPLAIFSMPAMKIFKYSDFTARPYLEFLFATVIFYFGIVFFEHAKHEIKSKKYGMMTLVSLAVGSGYLFSAVATFVPSIDAEFYLEISTLIWVLLFGHYLEAKSSYTAGDALQEVAKLLPKQAHLIIGGNVKDVPITDLKQGDTVLIKPGEKVPADGIIIKGNANFDEALISGESKPLNKSKNDQIVAGSICLDGSVEFKLNRVGVNSTIGQIQNLIAQAQQTKPSAQKIADRASGILTFVALGVAIVTLAVWSLIVGESFVFAMTLAITVLVIACPHALGLAIPTVSTIATKRAVDNGIFIKDMAKIEIMKTIDYIVFDKTGTLTEGKFGVTDIAVGNLKTSKAGNNLSSEQKDVLQIAASLEHKSSHMIGASIVNFAKSNNIKISEVTKFKNITGKGIIGTINSNSYFLGNEKLMNENNLLSAENKQVLKKLIQEGKTVVLLANNRGVIGLIALADKPKPQAKIAIERLHAMGIKVAMLTGDNKEVAKGIAGVLNIDAYFAEVLPENKYEYIKKLQDEGNKVAMVGDGVNDAPALTQADVGIAIGAGTDVAVKSGDVVLTRSNPADVVTLVTLSKKTFAKMVQNLFWALGYNTVAIPAAAGLFVPLNGFKLSPEIGALLMSLSSVIVVINANKLKRASLKE